LGSTALSEAQKQKVASKLVSRINKDGVLRVISQRTRSQEMIDGCAGNDLWTCSNMR